MLRTRGKVVRTNRIKHRNDVHLHPDESALGGYTCTRGVVAFWRILFRLSLLMQNKDAMNYRLVERKEKYYFKFDPSRCGKHRHKHLTGKASLPTSVLMH